MTAQKSIDSFLHSLAMDAPFHHQTIGHLRDALGKISPKTEERFMYGGIMVFIDDEPVCGFFAAKKHVSLEFTQGAELTDKYDVLEGKGKYRRHIKLQPGENLKEKHVEWYLKQAINAYVKKRK